MAVIIKLFRNRNFILILALALGLAIGENVAVRTQPLVLPALALVMTLSAANITSRDFTSLKAMPGQILISLLLNYVVMGGITLLMAWWLITDHELWTGFVVVAAVPPAVAVVPFSFMLGGNTLFSLVGMAGAYLAALVLYGNILTMPFTPTTTGRMICSLVEIQPLRPILEWLLPVQFWLLQALP